MTCGIVSIGWGRCQWLALPILLSVRLVVLGQGSTIFHQQFVTPDPSPLFPWDLQGQRVMGGPTVSVQWGLDMNIDGQPDFTFVSHEGESFQVVPNGNNAVLSYTFGPGGMNAWALPLSSLSPISADPGGYTWFHRLDSPFPPIPDAGAGFVAYTSEMGIGTFLGVESAYIGLQFMLDDGVHYGWARVGCPVAGLGGGWIYEAAYDIRPGTLILAGAVPEPSTCALVGFGFLALLIQRRRKSAG